MSRKTRFYLERPRPGKEALIKLRFTYKGQSLWMSTYEHVLTDHWDKSTQRIADKWCRRVDDYLEVNRTLDHLDQFIRATYNEYRRRHELHTLTIERLRSKVRERLIGEHEAKVTEPTVLQYYEAYYTNRERAGNLGIQSLKSERVSINWFIQFQDHLGYEVRFADVSLALFEKYRDFFWGLPEQRTDSTIYKYLRKFKQLCIHAAASGKVLGCDIANVKLKSQLRLSPQAMDTIALYTEELEMLAAYESPDAVTKEQVRDVFIAGCCTGLRVNRWSEISAKNIIQHDGQKMLSLFTAKGTRRQVVLPLHPMLEVIGRRYDWNLPRYSPVIINRYIKEICRSAGMMETIRLTRNIRGKSRIVSFKKYELISTHTARRSFATNAYSSGMSLDDIQALTGHADRKTLLHYIKEDGRRRAARLKSQAFYQDNK
jgi:site-specific recombinase XerD